MEYLVTKENTMSPMHTRYLRPWILGALGYLVVLALTVLGLTLLARASTLSTAAGLSWLTVVVPSACGAAVAALALRTGDRRTRFDPLVASLAAALLAGLLGVAAYLVASSHATGGGSVGGVVVPVVTALLVGLAFSLIAPRNPATPDLTYTSPDSERTP